MAEAVEETAADGDDGPCGHWRFMYLCQEVEMWEGNFTSVIVESVGAFKEREFVFWEHSFVLSKPGRDSV